MAALTFETMVDAISDQFGADLPLKVNVRQDGAWFEVPGGFIMLEYGWAGPGVQPTVEGLRAHLKSLTIAAEVKSLH